MTSYTHVAVANGNENQELPSWKLYFVKIATGEKTICGKFFTLQCQDSPHFTILPAHHITESNFCYN